MGAFPPPVGGSAPTCPPVRRKNGQNQPFSAKFLNFCPLRIAFCPLVSPTKVSGAATVLNTGGQKCMKRKLVVAVSSLIGVRFIQCLTNVLLKPNVIIFNSDLFIEYSQQMNSCLKLVFLENSKCSFCNKEIETMKHLMCKCKHVASFKAKRFKYHS